LVGFFLSLRFVQHAVKKSQITIAGNQITGMLLNGGSLTGLVPRFTQTSHSLFVAGVILSGRSRAAGRRVHFLCGAV
jgi:hypothetical protein